ncbi:MAG: HEAT repeat domain-containing protein, partial [Candidatus Omnitrophota bacterium]
RWSPYHLRKLLSNVVEEESKTHIEYGIYVHKGGPSDVGSRYIEDIEERVVDSKGEVKVVFDWAEFEMIKSKFRDKSALSETSPDNNERAAKKSRKVTLAGILESVRYLEKYHLVGWHIIRLGSNDYRVRDKAIAKLAKIGELAVKPLIRVLRHENVLVRIGAARALGLIGSAEAVDPLIDLLLMDKLSYFSAATALAAIGDRKALDPLIKTLGKCPLVEIPGVRNFIEKHANEDSVELLSEKLSDDNFDVKKFIIKLLRKIRDKRATKSLIDLVRNSSELGSVRAEAAKALLEIDDADVLEREFGEDYRLALKTYALISDNGAYVDEIIKIGRPAAPVLLSFLAKNCSRSYEPWVISTLGKIGGKGVFEALVASGKRDDWTLEALADLGDSRAVVILTEELIKEFEGPYLVHRVYTEHLRFHVGMGYAEALKPLIEHRDTLTGAYWKLAPVVIRKGDFEQIDLLREGLAMLVRQKLDEYTCANGTLEVDPPGKIVKLPEESYETIVSKLTDFAMKTGDAVALTRVMRSAVSVHHVLSKKYDFASPSEYGEIAIAVDWEKLEWSIRNEIAKAESARKEDAEGSDKDNTHAFKAQDGFNAAKISAVPFLIGIAGAVISFILNHGGFTWVTAAALVVGAYSGAAMLKYYFLGEQIHYRLARYFRREFAGLTADDAVVKAGKIMAEASLSQEERDEVWAFIEKHQRDDDFKEALAAVLGERIPIAKSDGYRHELFEKLPSTVQKQINIHEAFSHFWGMMRILPIISFFDGERHGSALKQIKQKKKDDAHPFAAKEGYKAAEITGLLLFPGSLFFLGAAGMVALLVQAQWNITGAVIAAGGVALYFGLASIKYYFISEEVHRGMKKYLTEQFGRWTESDVVAKSFLMVHDARFPKEEREKLLSFINKYRDNEDFKEKVADYLAGRLPVARSDGYRHPVFRDDLIPYLAPQIKTSINIHESFKSCFRGTISMLPVISLFYRLAWARKRRIMLAYASSDSCGRALEAANSDFEDARQEAFKNLTGMIAESPDLKATLSMLDTGGVRFRPSYEDAIIILKAVREAAPADIRRDILGNYANWGVEMIPEKLVEPQHPGEAPKEPKPGSVQSDASWTRTCMKYHEELAEYASRKNAYKKEVKVYKEEAKRAKKDFKTGELFIERRRIVLDLSGLEALSKDPERLKAEVLAWKGANPLPEDGREAEKDGAHSFRVMTGIKAGGVTGLMLLPGAAFIVDSLIAGHIGISAASIGTAVVTAFLAWSFGRYLLVADNVRAKMRIHLEGRLGKGLTVGDIRVRVNKMMYDASLTAEEQDKVRRFMDKHDGEDNFREKLISYLSYILPIARSNGYCLYIFDELPERTQRLIYIHETFKSCFWGTVAMLPIISLAFSDRIRRSKDEQLKYSRLDGDSQSTNANGLYRAALSDIPHISARAY